jgi:hypothetical protein
MSEEPAKATMPLLQDAVASQEDVSVHTHASSPSRATDGRDTTLDNEAFADAGDAEPRLFALAPMSTPDHPAHLSTSAGRADCTTEDERLQAVAPREVCTGHGSKGTGAGAITGNDILSMREAQATPVACKTLVTPSTQGAARAGTLVKPERSVQEREADGYAHACQAVFAGYIAVAHRQNVRDSFCLYPCRVYS